MYRPLTIFRLFHHYPHYKISDNSESTNQGLSTDSAWGIYVLPRTRGFLEHVFLKLTQTVIAKHKLRADFPVLKSSILLVIHQFLLHTLSAWYETSEELSIFGVQILINTLKLSHTHMSTKLGLRAHIGHSYFPSSIVPLAKLHNCFEAWINIHVSTCIWCNNILKSNFLKLGYNKS